MPEQAIGIVGLACRYPEAPDLESLWDLVLTGRRAFRLIPPGRFGLDNDDGNGGNGTSGPAWCTRAALIEGWEFDTAAGRLHGAARGPVDLGHVLALETAARALNDAGFPGGQGIGRERAGVIIGCTRASQLRQAATLRLRWPYIRSAMAAALTGAAGCPPGDWQAEVLETAARRFAAALPEVTADTLAGGLVSSIAGRICGHFGFRGGAHAVDGACSSSLIAIATACTALATGDLDFALAGGVDIGIDLFDLTGFASTGALATSEMRIYDAAPTGFLLGEGCGMVALMRAEDAHAAGAAVYADITGWGISSAGNGRAVSGPDGLLLALRRAYQRAQVDPAHVQLLEGHAAGTAASDLAELTALTWLRAGARRPSALGSIKANIGHTGGAAGVAGLLKTVLAMSAGTLPPTTGCEQPHPLLRSTLAVRVLATAEPWPDGQRLAGVTTMGFGGTNAHVVLCRGEGPDVRREQARPAKTARPAKAEPAGAPQPPGAEVYAFSRDDPAELASTLSRVAAIAEWFSDGELRDLARQEARTALAGRARVAFAAAGARDLARRAEAAATLVPGLTPGVLAGCGGVFAGDGVRGRVVLLLAGTDHDATKTALRWLDRLGVSATAAIGHGAGEILALTWAGCLGEVDAAVVTAALARVARATAAAGTTMLSICADAATVCALAEGTGAVIAAYHAPRAHVLAGAATAVAAVAERAARCRIATAALPVALAFHCPAPAHAAARGAAALRQLLGSIAFGPPLRRVISTVTGREIRSCEDIPGLLWLQLTAPVRFHEPVRAAAPFADPFCEAGPGRLLAGLAAQCGRLPAVSAGACPGGTGQDGAGQDGAGQDGAGQDGAGQDGTGQDGTGQDGTGQDGTAATCAAALFAAGAVTSLEALSGGTARPVDIWRERVFITGPPATDRAGGAPQPRDEQKSPGVAPAALSGLIAPGWPGPPRANESAAAQHAAAQHAAAQTGAAQPGTALPATAHPATAHPAAALPAAALPAAALPGAALPTARAPAARQYRFLETVRVHHPGVELVADAALGADTDPYLADYQPQGPALLPAVIGLEAMAQAASVLAGQPLRQARCVELVSAVAVPGDGAGRIRVCALRRGTVVETVLRSACDGYRSDRLRAVFPVPGAPPPDTVLPGAPSGGAPSPSTAPGSTMPGSSAAGSTVDGSTVAGSTVPGDVPVTGGPFDGMSTSIVDGAELYGPLCAHAGRFRRVAFLPALTTRACRALLRGADDQPWFGPGLPGGPLLLGSPGINDAAVHVLQACLPHRRLVAAGCESMTASGLAVSGTVEIRARERAATAAGYVWDVTAVDADGAAVVTWTGLRLTDNGPLVRSQPWTPALLAVYLESAAASLWRDPRLQVTIRAGDPHLACGGAGVAAGRDGAPGIGRLLAHLGNQAVGAGTGPAEGLCNGSRHPPGESAGHGPPGNAEPGPPGNAEPGRPGNAGHGPPGNAGHGPNGVASDGGGHRACTLWQARTGPASRAASHLDGLTLTVETAAPAICSCAWAAAATCHDQALADLPGTAALRDVLRQRCGEPAATVSARIRTAAECVSKAGLPSGAPLVLDQVHDDGWVLLRSGDAVVASAVVAVSGVPGPVAVAIMTSAFPAHSAGNQTEATCGPRIGDQ